MKQWSLLLGVAVVVGCSLSSVPAAEPEQRPAAERGLDVLLRRPLTPALWSVAAYENAWKQWGIKEKPAAYGQAFRERYGLLAATHENHGLPLGLMETKGRSSKGILTNCLLCHAGSIAGQTYFGLGNASLDLQALFDELIAADGQKITLPFSFSYLRGTIDPLSPVAFLMGLRDADLNLQFPVNLTLFKDVCSKPPAWWLLKKKKTRDWTGVIDARSTRVDLAFLLSPLNSGAYIKGHESVFADINAYLHGIEAPKYPFAVDGKLAAHGQTIFEQTCARCHGTYGPDGSYPNRIVPLAKLGTDPLLAEGGSDKKTIAHLNKSWLAQQLGPDGKPYRFIENPGYQAPPLEGIWATAPYFHNGSVPTIYHVLNSAARPKVYTRSFRTGKDDYDPVKLGWKITTMDRPPNPALVGIERRKIYDATRRGQSNGGHPYGDKLTEEERLAVIEYLKTL